MESNEIENHQENEICENSSREPSENVASTLLKEDYLLPIEHISTGNEAERKRRVHNEVEQRRKCKINSGIDKLGQVIPACIQDKKSKTQVLELALDYIAELRDKYDNVLVEGAETSLAEELESLKKENNHLREENKKYSAMVNNIKVNSNVIHEIKSRSKKSRNSQRQVFAKVLEPTDFSADIAKLSLEMEQILAHQNITVEPSNANQNVTHLLDSHLSMVPQQATTNDLGLITARNVPQGSTILQNQQSLNSALEGATTLTTELVLKNNTSSNSALINASLNIQHKPDDAKINDQGQMMLLSNQKLTQAAGNQHMTLQMANVNTSSTANQNVQILQQTNQIQLQTGLPNQPIAVSTNKPIQQIQLAAGNTNHQTAPSIQLPGSQNILVPSQVTDQSKAQMKNIVQSTPAVALPQHLNRTSVCQTGQPPVAGNSVLQPLRLIVPIMTTATGQASMTQQLTFRLPNGQTQTFPLRIIPASTGAPLTTSQTTTTSHASNLMPLATVQTPPAVPNTSGMVRIQPAPAPATTTTTELKPNHSKKKKSNKIKHVTESSASVGVGHPASTFTVPGNHRIVRLQTPIQIGQKNPSGTQNLVYLQQSGQLIPIYLPANASTGQNVQNIIAGQTGGGIITAAPHHGPTQMGNSQSESIQLTSVGQHSNQSFTSCQPHLVNSNQTQLIPSSQHQQITIVTQAKENALNQCNTSLIPTTGTPLLQSSDQQDALATIMASSEISDPDSGIESQDLQKNQKPIVLQRTEVSSAPLSPLSVLTAELGINEDEDHSSEEKPSSECDGSSQDILAKAAASIFSPGSLAAAVDVEQDVGSMMQISPRKNVIEPQENFPNNSNSSNDQRPPLMEPQPTWMSTEVEQSESSDKIIVPSKSNDVHDKVNVKDNKGSHKVKVKPQPMTSDSSCQLQLGGAALSQGLLQMADMPSEIQSHTDMRSEDNQNYQQSLVTSHSSCNQSSTSRYSAEALLSGMTSAESPTISHTVPSPISSASSTASNSSFPSYTGSSTNFVNDILSNSMSASGLPTYINEEEQNQPTNLFSPYKSSNKATLEATSEDFTTSQSAEPKKKKVPTGNAIFSSPGRSMTPSDLLNLTDSVSDLQSQSSIGHGQPENVLTEFLSPTNSESSIISEQEPKLIDTATPSSTAQYRHPSSWISHHSRASELASVTQQSRSQSNQPQSAPFSTTTCTVVTSQSPTSRPSFFSQPWLTTTSTTSTTSTPAFAQSVFSSPIASTARSSPNLVSPQYQLSTVNSGSVIIHSTQVTESPSRQRSALESKISPSSRVFTKETIHRTLTMDITEDQPQEAPKPKKHHTLPITVPDRPPISVIPDRPLVVPKSAKVKGKSSRRKKKTNADKNGPSGVEIQPPNISESLANVGKRELDKDLVDKFPWLADGINAIVNQEKEMAEQGLRPNVASSNKHVTSFSVQTLSQSSNKKGDAKLSKENLSNPPKIVSKQRSESYPTTKLKDSEVNSNLHKTQLWSPTSRFEVDHTQRPDNSSRQRSSQLKAANEPSNTSSVITSNHITYPRYLSPQRTTSTYTPVDTSRPSFPDTIVTTSSRSSFPNVIVTTSSRSSFPDNISTASLR